MANDCEKLAKKAEDYAVEVNAEDMSVERDSAQTKAGGELKDIENGARGADEARPMRE